MFSLNANLLYYLKVHVSIISYKNTMKKLLFIQIKNIVFTFYSFTDFSYYPQKAVKLKKKLYINCILILLSMSLFKDQIVNFTRLYINVYI